MQPQHDRARPRRSPPKCSGRLAPERYIWFGGDPIRIIALSPTPMG